MIIGPTQVRVAAAAPRGQGAAPRSGQPQPAETAGRVRVPLLPGQADRPAGSASRAGRTAIQTLVKAVTDDANSVLERQLFIAVVYVLSQLLLFIPGVAVVYTAPVVVGGALIAVATAGAFAFRGRLEPPPVVMVIPMIDILAVGFLRAGTGGYSSIFTIMMVLPVLSLGIERGRLPVLIGGPVTVLALLLPVFNDADVFADGQWIRLLFTPVMLGLLCLSVNELTRRLRSRLQAVRELQLEQQSLLAAVEDQVEFTTAASALARESTSQLTSTINAVTEQSIIATDRSGRIEVFNSGAQKMLKVASHDAIGRPITRFHVSGELVLSDDDIPTDAVTGAEPERAMNPFVALVRGVSDGTPRRGDWTYVTRTGDEIRVSLSITERRDAAGRVDGYLFVATDVTQDRAQAAVRDEFVAAISGELRTPLDGIIGDLQQLEPLPEDQQRHLRSAERHLNRLQGLVSDLMFTSQVESGALQLHLTEVDMRALLHAAVDRARLRAEARHVRLVLAAAGSPVVLCGDRRLLSQAADNLIDNAVKFTPAGGRVAVILSSPADDDSPRVLISVNDTGMGIPADEMDRLFGRFFRASTATKSAIPGVGLGLSITRAIAQSHGGVVRVASTVGEGSCFTLDLPLRAPVAARSA